MGNGIYGLGFKLLLNYMGKGKIIGFGVLRSVT